MLAAAGAGAHVPVPVSRACPARHLLCATTDGAHSAPRDSGGGWAGDSPGSAHSAEALDDTSVFPGSFSVFPNV